MWARLKDLLRKFWTECDWIFIGIVVAIIGLGLIALNRWSGGQIDLLMPLK
jgi:uncharacterized membrane protein